MSYWVTKIYRYFLPSCHLIIPRLWLGDITSALDVDFLTRENIDIIINCTPDQPFFDSTSHLDNMECVRVPVYDSLLERDFLLMEEYIKILLPYLLQQYVHNKRHILVHCHAGKQRSGILVASLLFVLVLEGFIQPNEIGLRKLPTNRRALADKIFSFLLSKRPQVFTFGFRINFIKSFQRCFGL